jgi:uncharacterized protein YqgC (DUF456 family)
MMDIILLVIGFNVLILGILGSLIPLIPGPLVSWVGLLILHFTNIVDQNWSLLGVTFGAMVVIGVLDYIIPAVGAKKFGGSRYGIIGTQAGLVAGLIFFPPFGMLLGAMLGAFFGELVKDSKDTQRALKAAFGSFIGFISSTFLKVCFTVTFLVIYVRIFWNHRGYFLQELEGMFSFI